MRKIVILTFMMIVTAFSVYSIDAEKAKKALAEGVYIPALMDYGFTEQQIRSWRIAGSYLSSYFTPNSIYSDPSMTIGMIRNCIQLGEITANDMTKIEQFLKDIYAFWLNERRQTEEASRQRAQAAEEQKAQAQEQRERELVQYAKTFGLVDFVDGILETLAEITPNNLDLAKKVMIVPNDVDQLYSVQNIVDGYVIYSAVLQGRVYQVALVAERGKSYPSKSQIDLYSVYKVDGARRFARTLGGSADIIVISRLGPRR
jgi:hypothetical protein